jgi:hypothetical protein
MQLAFRARGLANTLSREELAMKTVSASLDDTQADVRNHREYLIELGGVWKFQAA